MVWINYEKIENLNKNLENLYLLVDENFSLSICNEFKELHNLYLKGPITNIELIPEQIKRLEIYKHNIANLDLSHQNLQQLTIKCGPLTKINTSLPMLELLNLNQNKLTKMPLLRDYRYLKNIYLQKNQIEYLDFDCLPDFTEKLYLSGNKINRTNLIKNKNKVMNLKSIDI